MYRLFVHRDAQGDLERLYVADPVAAARVVALLESIAADQDLLDRLTQHDFGAYRSAEFHVSKWYSQWNKGKDLWRLKTWDLEEQRLQYRVVYAYVPGSRRYHVLGVLHRNQVKYDDPSDPYTKRILRAFDAL